MNPLWLAVLVLHLFTTGCSKPAPAPSLSLVSPLENLNTSQEALSIPDSCKGLKIVGELTVTDFKKLFDCLNKKGNLNSLEPLLFQNPENSSFFVKIYNDTFGKAQNRKETLKLIESLEINGGLSDLLTLISLFITEFIDTPNFDQTLKKLLHAILTDNIELFPLLKTVVSYPHKEELLEIIRKALDNGVLANHFIHFGNFLREPLVPEQTIHFLNQAKLSDTPTFNLEDLYQLSFFKLPRGFLEVLYKLQMTSKLDTLLELTKNVTTHQTAAILTQERLKKMRSPGSLSQEQEEASLEIVRKHPANDLAALVKLVSGLNRKFNEDETHERNLLYSLDTFIQGVKTAFDAEYTLGPDSAATRVVTIYSLFLNIAYLEIMSREFHAKSLDEKFSLYTNGALSQKFILDYQDQKTRHVLAAYKQELEKDPQYTPGDIRRLIRQREREFKEKELPLLLDAYKAFLHTKITNALSLINTHPLFLNFTIYDFLIKVKENKEPLALFGQKALLNLDNELLEKFIQEVIQGLLKDFFEFNRPVDQFLRSLDIEFSGSTWLSHTVNPLIHGFGNTLPMKDQMTLIAVIESYQALERLLITENKVNEIKEVLLPFLKVVSNTGQDQRVLNVVSALHSGKFTDGHSEEKEPITHISRLLVSMIDSGFFKNILDLTAFLGKDADSINRFLEYLTRSYAKSEFLKNLDNHFSIEDSSLLKEQIIYDVHTLTQSSELPLLTQKLSRLRSPPEHSFLIGSDYPLLGALKTLHGLAKEHPQAFKNILLEFGHFLTAPHIQKLESFLKKYKSPSTESIITRMIKTGEIEMLFKITQKMLEENTFQKTHGFIKELIDSGELEKTLQLLIKLLRIQEK